MSTSVFTLSNAISVMRMLLAVPVYQALVNGETERAVIIMLVAFASDILDGTVARSTKTISEAGKIIDPLADKIFVGACVIALLVQNMLPLWYVSTIVGRDMLILIGSLFLRKKIGVVAPSNYLGKATVVVISLVLITSLFVQGTVLTVVMWSSVFFIVWSLANYSLRLFRR